MAGEVAGWCLVDLTIFWEADYDHLILKLPSDVQLIFSFTIIVLNYSILSLANAERHFQKKACIKSLFCRLYNLYGTK